MTLKGLASRIETLERRGGGRECQGCNETAAKRMAEISKRRMATQTSEPYPIEDWSLTDLVRCPQCGSPEPRMTLRFARSFIGQ